MMEEEEKEFSFADLFFYCIKKWFIVAVAAVIGIVAGLAVWFFQKDRDEYYRVSVAFCSLEVYKYNNPTSSDPPIQLEPEYSVLYSSATDNFRRIMTSTETIAEFVNTSDFVVNIAKAFPKSVSNIDELTEKDCQVLFTKNVSLITSGFVFNAGISGEFDTDEKREAAKAILTSYAEFAKSKVYESNPSLKTYTDTDGNEIGAISVSNPIFYITDAALSEDNGVLNKIIMGFLIGFVIGAVAVIVIYFIDPRVKSPASLTIGGEIIAKTKDSSLKREAVLRIAGKTKDEKMLLVASPEQSEFTDSFARAVAGEFAAAGLRTLYVDFSGKEADGEGIKDFFGGKAIADVVTKEDGYDTVTANSREDVISLMSKKEKFVTLKDDYDKIVVAYADSADGGAVALGGVVDKVVYVINQKITKRKNLEILESDIDNREAEIGIYIHNAI